MLSHARNKVNEDSEALYQYYMEIINSMPNSVYWVDAEGNLKGCNNNFVTLLGLNIRPEISTPYQQMEDFAHWGRERIAKLKVDDMNVIFSGIPQHNVTENPIVGDKGTVYYFQSSRVPIHNRKKEIIGLIVILNDVTSSHPVSDSKHVLLKNNKDNENSLKNGYLPRILMVEDNVIAQNVEKALLTALHCQVDIADSAESAVNLFSPGKYDLVLMDIALEASSGYVVAKQVRQREKETQHHVPIIALTGFEADIGSYDCPHYFMDGVINNPLNWEQAEQLIKHYVYHMDVPVRGLKIR